MFVYFFKSNVHFGKFIENNVCNKFLRDENNINFLLEKYVHKRINDDII